MAWKLFYQRIKVCQVDHLMGKSGSDAGKILPGKLWAGFYDGMVRGLRVYVFYLAVLSLFRALFIVGMQDYLGEATGFADIGLALWRGFRLSMQTGGLLTLAACVPAGLAALASRCWGERLLQGLNAALLAGLSILFMARFPYYRQFHSGFNQLLFNTGNDDMYALLVSLVQEFYLPLRLLAALLIAWMLYRALQVFLCWQAPVLPRLPYALRLLGRAAFCAGLYVLALLSTFGGSLSWQTEVDWENAGVTRDALLNEAILDDGQAIWRAYTMNHRLLACNGLDFSTADIRTLAAGLAGRPADTDDLDVYLTRTAAGPKLAKPSHIFVIVSESYANWPLLDKYADLHIADGMRSILAEEDSDYCGAFLPDGASTVSAVTGIVTGFADANLYLTTMPEAFAGPYPTASAPQLQRLGYDTNFWYAGPATWERIGAFTQAQGYAHFYSRGDYGDVPGSVWGCEDAYLYAAVLAGLQKDVPSFNVILNVSNHSPYPIDVAAKGFDAERTREGLSGVARSDEELMRELGHYWYADHELAKFIRTVKQQYPDSLFVVVGDHADRYNVTKAPETYERFAIPFIITGRGVHKGLLLPDAAGSQIDIVPTIVDLIAPPGFRYEALGQSLARTSRRGVNYMLWITHDAIGKADTVPLVPESFDGGTPPAIDEAAMQDYINAVRSISWWRAKYGPLLDEAKLVGRE